MSQFLLQDRTALILGPINHLTRAISRSLTQQGGNVAFLCEGFSTPAQNLSRQLMDDREVNDRFGKAFSVDVQISSKDSLKDGISRVAETFGSIDIYIDTHSTHLHTQAFSQLQDLSLIERSLETNLRAPLLMTSMLLPYLKARKRGRIIYILSELAKQGLPQTSLLAASRMGLISFAKSLARELLEDRVLVNCLSLGATEDFLFDLSKGQESAEKVKEKLRSQVGWLQITDNERISSSVCYLASSLSNGVNGQVISACDGL